MKYTKRSKGYKRKVGGWFWSKKDGILPDIDDPKSFNISETLNLSDKEIELMNMIKRCRELSCNNPTEYFDIIVNGLEKLKNESLDRERMKKI